MAVIKQAIEFARSALSLCARVFHMSRGPTDDEIRGICSQLLSANDSDFESVLHELQWILRRRLGLPMSSYRHVDVNDQSFAFRCVLRLRQRQATNPTDAGILEKGQLKRRDRSAIVDDIARNERQKMSLLVEHRHILGDVSKELIEDSRNLVARTKKLIEQSKKTIDKSKSA